MVQGDPHHNPSENIECNGDSSVCHSGLEILSFAVHWGLSEVVVAFEDDWTIQQAPWQAFILCQGSWLSEEPGLVTVAPGGKL